MKEIRSDYFDQDVEFFEPNLTKDNLQEYTGK